MYPNDQSGRCTLKTKAADVDHFYFDFWGDSGRCTLSMKAADVWFSKTLFTNLNLTLNITLNLTEIKEILVHILNKNSRFIQEFTSLWHFLICPFFTVILLRKSKTVDMQSPLSHLVEQFLNFCLILWWPVAIANHKIDYFSMTFFWKIPACCHNGIVFIIRLCDSVIFG